MNTVLDDISAVIGFSATLKLVAWFGDGVANLYVPAVAEEGQLLPKIIGLSAARQMSLAWPKGHLNVPRLHNYEVELRKRHIARMVEKSFSVREIAGQLQMSERRVSQIKDELRSAGLLARAEEAQKPAEGTGEATPPAAASPVPAATVVEAAQPTAVVTKLPTAQSKRNTLHVAARRRN